MMDPKTVRKLEKELHKAIAEVIYRLGLQKLPLLPFGHDGEGGCGGLRSGSG